MLDLTHKKPLALFSLFQIYLLRRVATSPSPQFAWTCGHMPGAALRVLVVAEVRALLARHDPVDAVALLPCHGGAVRRSSGGGAEAHRTGKVQLVPQWSGIACRSRSSCAFL
jgi:hypothetical protein